MDIDPYSVIKRKRDGHRLDSDEIDAFVRGFTNGSIPDYQMSSLLMAIWFNGLDGKERAGLTESMVNTGDRLELNLPGETLVDKHSTGGVGDGVSLSLVPLVMSLGVRVPMMSGRGLGHTGGTLDKLESVPGIQVEFSEDDILRALDEVGGLIMSQTGDVAPADREMYSLRDVTATVDSVDLIASSIMSKKIAEDTDGLVLDVKTGSGAFMQEFDSSVELAKAMVDIGRELGLEVQALITDMNQPLGRAVGNSVELQQHIKILKGEGPEDLTELVSRLAGSMLTMAGKSDDTKDGYSLARETIERGEAVPKLKQMIEWQGGDPAVVDDLSLLPQASYSDTLKADREGYVQRIDAYEVGMGAKCLGAGRETMDSEIDHAAGVFLEKKVGDPVDQGDRLFEIVYNDSADVDEAHDRLEESIEVGDTEPDDRPLILGTVDRDSEFRAIDY